MSTPTVVIIVESPNKKEKILKLYKSIYGDKYNFIVKASYGHIRDLEKKKMSIDVNNNFQETYLVDDSKKHVVNDLRQTLKSNKCKMVWLAPDGDREGEAIAWHLSDVLKLTPETRKRVVFNAITKKDLQEAAEKEMDIDMNMVYAQRARRVLDRLIGFSLSPILWKQIQSSMKKSTSLSAGRVQSVVARLIIEREREIAKFSSSSFYKTLGQFFKEGKGKADILSSELSENFDTREKVRTFLDKCKTSEFKVLEIKKKTSTRKPSAPYITSTIQQDASTRFRMSPKVTMNALQKLFESAKITYHRSDSTVLSSEAQGNIEKLVLKDYGDKYLNLKQYKGKSQNTQDAHECIRPTDFSVPNLDSDASLGPNECRLYRLIWKRTVASQMSPAKVSIQNIKIGVSEREDVTFNSKNETITFDGFLRVYNPVVEKDDDDSDEDDKDKKPKVALKVGDILTRKEITSNEKYTKPPHLRFTEAGLIKKLDEEAIGRPSTYSSMISIVQDRKYALKKDLEGQEQRVRCYKLNGTNEVEKTSNFTKVGGEKQKLVPTDIGIIVNDFLIKHFDNILNYQFTANLESHLDDVAKGTKDWVEVVRNIYKIFNPKVVSLTGTTSLEKDNYKRVLGVDEDTDREISVYIAKYGPVVQLAGDDDLDIKPKFAPLKDIKITDVTLEQAKQILKYPYSLGKIDGKDAILAIGKYGKYLKYNGKNYSLPSKNKNDDDDEKEETSIIDSNITLDEAKKIIKGENDKQDSNLIKEINENIIIKNGKFGPYINYKKKLNVKIYGNKKPEDLTLEDCMVMINKKKQYNKKK